MMIQKSHRVYNLKRQQQVLMSGAVLMIRVDYSLYCISLIVQYSCDQCVQPDHAAWKRSHTSH